MIITENPPYSLRPQQPYGLIVCLLFSHGVSRFVPGDIALLGSKMFLFKRITPFGDYIVVSLAEKGSCIFGTKVGFMAQILIKMIFYLKNR